MLSKPASFRPVKNRKKKKNGLKTRQLWLAVQMESSGGAPGRSLSKRIFSVLIVKSVFRHLSDVAACAVCPGADVAFTCALLCVHFTPCGDSTPTHLKFVHVGHSVRGDWTLCKPASDLKPLLVTSIHPGFHYYFHISVSMCFLMKLMLTVTPPFSQRLHF